MVELHMRPVDIPLTREKFTARTPAYSIALDGYVAEGPWFDPSGPRQNFNHHEGVDRLATRATCGMVLMAIRQGLFDRFRDDSGPCAHVYVNDCDEDVCLSWWLLSHGYMAESVINPMVNRLVHMEDALDATAGAYPFPKDMPLLQEMAWVFEPYRRFRLSGGLARREAREFQGVVEDVGQRIMAHVTGRGGLIPLDTRYDRIGGEAGWVLVEEVGAQARTGMFSDGIRAFVAVQEHEGRRTVTLGRMSQYVRFPIPEILSRLNEAEGLVGDDRWGGGDTIGGSPRVHGTRLSTREISDVIRSCVGGCDD